MVRKVAIGVGVVLIAFVALLAGREAWRNDPSTEILGEPAPVIAGTSYDGQAVDVDALLADGQWVVVNFFASWCVPCLAENPELEAFVERTAGRDVSLVGIAVDDEPADVTAFFEEHGGGWPVIVGDEATSPLIVHFGVTAPPTTAIVTPGGIVVDLFFGEVTADQLEASLTAAGFR
jgi:cytochrome c biogenesis protein CcmG, thiol:disulfide interchange protein DsbE